VDVFPNPTNDKIYIEINQQLNLQAISVVNLAGKVVYQQRCTHHPAEKMLEIDLSDQEPGIYIINLVNSEQKISLKLLKR
jgi:hypothetical protein